MSSSYLQSLETAKFKYDSAFHLLNVTYPMVEDPKLFLGVINNLRLSLEAGMDAILQYERQLHLVPHYVETDFQSKFNLFRSKSVKRNNIPQKFVDLMMHLQQLEEQYKQSSVSFQRGNRYLIATKNYEIQSLSLKELRNHLNATKEFLAFVPGLLKFQ